MKVNLGELKRNLSGELHADKLSRIIYSTDASVYQESPLAVVLPKNKEDIRQVILFANENKLSIIPRSGGTSLSGQCVGNGIVVDVSKYMNGILSFDEKNRTITVQPGLIRDELNRFLKKYGLFFPPITSTSNRATIGGMVGNNSCGTNSIVYGSTRDYVKNIKAYLSDGSEVVFEKINSDIFSEKCGQNNFEGKLYRHIKSIFNSKENIEEIKNKFPKKSVTRRNTGYALDYILDEIDFENNAGFNFCKLIAGSEGTLAFATEITLNLKPLPPEKSVIAICQYDSVKKSLEAVYQSMKHKPFACELMDKKILDCTRENIKYKSALEYFSGIPEGVLLIEFRADTIEEARAMATELIDDLKTNTEAYAFSTAEGDDVNKIWALRSAGLGLLANLPGDEKAVACIEDTAVAVEDLAEYIEEFDELMAANGQSVVHYAHAGAGELHLRPILNLKKKEDQQKFYDISLASAELVKKYNGSISGEHGDGRVRAPFIPILYGEKIYGLFQEIKTTWDPHNIFNPNKIVNPKPMNTDLRYEENQDTPEFETIFDFSKVGGLLRMAEKCNGSGDCRKTHLAGGTMCPSFHATKNEKHTTRGRANALRTLLTLNEKPNPFNHQELKEVLDLCLSCKGCTAECPSNVDMSALKAEFLFQYQKTNGVPFRSWAFSHVNFFNKVGSVFPVLSNFFFSNKITSTFLKNILDVSPKRSFPNLQKTSLRKWFIKKFKPSKHSQDKTAYFFCDEFTNYNDTEIGKKAIKLLDKLGYEIKMILHDESGRAAISKGLLKKAKKHANNNVEIFQNIINEKNVLVGIEPSAILSFRDEYPKLVDDKLKSAAENISKYTFLIEEFLATEIKAFNISNDVFDKKNRQLLVHGHCHQKALSNMSDVFTLLSFPENHQVEIIDSGCCGMAGSFGYEKEHYEVSMEIGNLVLFPAIRNKQENQIVVASGTSCRHQILDGTEVRAWHPVEVLLEALKK